MSTGVIRLSADKRCKRSRACCSTAMTNASWTVLQSSSAVIHDTRMTKKNMLKLFFPLYLIGTTESHKKMLNKYLIVNSEVLYQVKTVNVFESNGPTRVKHTEKNPNNSRILITLRSTKFVDIFIGISFLYAFIEFITKPKQNKIYDISKHIQTRNESKSTEQGGEIWDVRKMKWAKWIHSSSWSWAVLKVVIAGYCVVLRTRINGNSI